MSLQREHFAIDDVGRFAKFHGVDINGIRFERIGGFPIDAGVAVKLNAAEFDRSKPLLTVPLPLVLSHTYIEEQSKMDGQLREILVANRPFSFSPRGMTAIEHEKKNHIKKRTNNIKKQTKEHKNKTATK